MPTIENLCIYIYFLCFFLQILGLFLLSSGLPTYIYMNLNRNVVRSVHSEYDAHTCNHKNMTATETLVFKNGFFAVKMRYLALAVVLAVKNIAGNCLLV